jgi:opacity protein-like surface antigen
LLGGGIEYALGTNLSAKVEYNLMDFGGKTLRFTLPAVAGGGFRDIEIDQTVQVLKFGLNYRFGGGKSVVARY